MGNDLGGRTHHGYDEIHRLKAASGPWGAGTACGGLTYTYDKNGNRQCKGEGSPATTYTYTANTNRLASTTGGEAASYSYDSNGNITGDGTHSYAFSQANRLATVDPGTTPTATYTYDGESRRATKTASGATTYYFYDPTGRLLTETSGMPGSGKDYLYLDGAPVGRVDWTVTESGLGNVLQVSENSSNEHLDWTSYPSGSNLYVVRRKQVVNPADKSFNGSTIIATLSDPTKTYDDPVRNDGNQYDYNVFLRGATDTLYFYHTDHLGTPIAMTDGSGTLKWRAEHVPFGGIWSLTASAVPSNLRFPGQYFDGETGLHQNWFRDYLVAAGRYREPDPLGVDAGMNLFVYAQGDPVGGADPRGLLLVRCTRPLTGGIGSKNPASQRRHVLLYSTRNKTGCGLGPTNRFLGLLSAVAGVSSKGVLEIESPYDENGKIKPEYDCETVSSDDTVEDCVAHTCQGPAPDYSVSKGPACYDWVEDVLRACQCGAKR